MVLRRAVPDPRAFEARLMDTLDGGDPVSSPGHDLAAFVRALPSIQELMTALEKACVANGPRSRCWERGYAVGRSGAEQVVRSAGPDQDPVEALLVLPYLLAVAGTGMNAFAFDDETHSLEWTFRDGTPVARAAEDGAGPCCAFFEGLGTGWFEGGLGLRLAVREIACVAAGRSACRFEGMPP